MLVGQPIKLADFQKAFIRDVYDNPHGTRHAILSTARKNAKTATIACLLLAHLIGPEKQQGSQIISGALSRDQAALVFNLACKMLDMQPAFEGLYRIVPSGKRIYGLRMNVEYRALAADGTTAHGLSPVLSILDEVGQVRGPTTPFLDAILSASGAHEAPLSIFISTQAASDADFLSLRIDDAKRSGDPHTVCHVHEADKNCELLDKEQWKKANPALGLFRSEKDLEEQLKQAARLPAIEASARNLLLNQRISLESLWLAPAVWKENRMLPDLALFTDGRPVAMGLDLSQRNDLTAAVLAVEDDDKALHLLPFCFTPMAGLKQRELRDRAPYTAWVKAGHLIAVPGSTLDYDWLFQWLKQRLDEMEIRVDTVQFDRWRIKEAQAAAERAGFVAGTWVEVGQGYRDMAPRVEHFESMLLQGRIRHGDHPVLNMGAANAIAVKDPAGNRKLEKAKSTQRIDPLVAAVMVAYAFTTPEAAFDPAAYIG
jgi:phage terminase large subunit-like protein